MKWHKKCLGVFNLKENNKLSPMELFEYRGHDFLANSRLTKYYPEGDQLPASSAELDAAINNVLKRSDLFRIVLIMQLLFHKPWNLLKGHDFMELTTEVDLPTHMLGIERKLIKLLCEQHLTYKEGSHLGGLQIGEA
mgnify:FL=1